jgi:hypothetical protein
MYIVLEREVDHDGESGNNRCLGDTFGPFATYEGASIFADYKSDLSSNKTICGQHYMDYCVIELTHPKVD